MAKATVVLALPLLLLGVMASSSCLIVDVKHNGPEPMHIVFPVPLALAQAALVLVPEAHTRVPCPEAGEIISMARRLIAALEDTADAELVRVEEGDELVVVSKVNGRLEIEVYDDHEEVHVTVPIKTAEEILHGFDGESFEASEIVAALRRVSSGELLHVRDGDEEVKVRVW